MKTLIALVAAALALVGLANDSTIEIQAPAKDGESNLKSGVSAEVLLKNLDGDRFQEQYPLLAGTSFVRDK